MTRHLSKNTPNAPGITGADSLRSNNQFVKYDPTYIYNSALRTYGFLQLDQRTTIASAIRSYALQWQSRPEQMRTESEDVANDANEAISYRLFCEFPRELGYKFPEECHLDVNQAEREYIKEHIHPGMTLIEIRNLCESKMLELGADSFWYWDVGAFVFAGDETTLSVSGKEYITSDRVISRNDIITIDLSPQIKNCATDRWYGRRNHKAVSFPVKFWDDPADPRRQIQ